MANIERSIDVDVPVRTAYDQWTQFEEFPSFMEGVEEVRQIDDTHTALAHEDRRPREGVGRGRSPSRSPTSASPGRATEGPSTPAS